MELVIEWRPSRQLQAWSDIFNDASRGGCTRDKHITYGMMRDLADETKIDDDLDQIRALVDEWSKFRRSHGENMSVVKPELLQLCMAAACRQLCRGDNSNISWFMGMAYCVFDNLGGGWTITGGQQCYALLDLLCHYVVLRLEHDSVNEDFVPAQLNEFTNITLAKVEFLAEDSSPEALAMRRHTLRAWENINTLLLERESLPEWNAAWHSFAQLWPEVKGRIPPMPDDGEEQFESPFHWLKRCGWDACLCSRHAHGHKMRVCTRCKRVAYCGEQCQRKDWESGGHKTYCRKRNV
ncbi:zinc finger MYND domain-containing protein [Phanerochaete sordida]|uniref:Zinc finger MYND domain-containing protein n=1 Tax=Phanerochaete sordida TaxID=48140 RepID=A0A9P3LDT0_9APHY|nr:zinc finger MYND domain-containing protein [Phanerochaete sordida]